MQGALKRGKSVQIFFVINIYVFIMLTNCVYNCIIILINV